MSKSEKISLKEKEEAYCLTIDEKDNLYVLGGIKDNRVSKKVILTINENQKEVVLNLNKANLYSKCIINEGLLYLINENISIQSIPDFEKEKDFKEIENISISENKLFGHTADFINDSKIHFF
jgi:hypothetical protein